jgi:hypothetical protein
VGGGVCQVAANEKAHQQLHDVSQVLAGQLQLFLTHQNEKQKQVRWRSLDPLQILQGLFQTIQGIILVAEKEERIYASRFADFR